VRQWEVTVFKGGEIKCKIQEDISYSRVQFKKESRNGKEELEQEIYAAW
jgi:hypothetical protein